MEPKLRFGLRSFLSLVFWICLGLGAWRSLPEGFIDIEELTAWIVIREVVALTIIFTCPFAILGLLCGRAKAGIALGLYIIGVFWLALATQWVAHTLTTTDQRPLSVLVNRD
jgi:hypothetical protein